MPIIPANNVEVRDEGTTQGRVRTLDFVGSGVVASVVGSVATVTVSGGGGGSPTFTALVQDLGAARRSGMFDITGLSGLTTDKVVAIVQTAAQVASKGNARDEFEMDAVVATGYVVSATTIRVYWFAANGSVIVGDVAFGYWVGA